MTKRRKGLDRTDYAVSALPGGKGFWLTGSISDDTLTAHDAATWGTYAEAWTTPHRGVAAAKAKQYGGFVVDLRVVPLSTRTRASKHRTR